MIVIDLKAKLSENSLGEYLWGIIYKIWAEVWYSTGPVTWRNQLIIGVIQLLFKLGLKYHTWAKIWVHNMLKYA